MADKIVVLHDGLVEQIGAPLDLYDGPANLFVAGFIGSPAMNFIHGRIEEGIFRGAGGLTLPLPEGIQPTDAREGNWFMAFGPNISGQAARVSPASLRSWRRPARKSSPLSTATSGDLLPFP